MQNTTANYKLEINKPSREFECKITIGNNIYNNDELVNLTLEHTQPQEGFSIGDTISQSLDLTLLNRGDIIYSTSQIKVEIGLKIGSTIEYILMGIFNIDDIEKTDYTTKFTAYDNMIKFETPYFSSLGDKPTLKQVVNELSKITGIEFIGSLPNYTVSKLEGFTCREVLSYVASICGGNAVITRDGKFTIKSLSEIKKSIDGNNYFDYKREEVKYKIGKISCQIDENNILYKGSTGTDSMELGFENPWVTETILNDVYNKLNGLSYLGYSMKWQGDLSLDPYDIVTVTDIKNVIRKIPILSQKISYTGGLTSEIGAKGESKNKNNFSSSGSTTNKVNRAVIEQAIIKEALIEKANIKDVEAVSIRTQILEAKTAKIEEAIIDVAHISDLNAINANIQNLIANDVKINNALINKADITELNAVVGNINIINSELANIKTLVNGNLSSENIQAGGITSDKLTIANGFITNAMIANLDVSKINAGNISTNKFRIVSDNGGIEIVGATQQFKDKNNKVRIQMGQDAKGNFNFILRGEDGTTTLIDHTGIKEKAIADNLIKGNMVATDAIGEKQINYSSLITGLNKDTNTKLIKASKVAIDFVGQSLEVAFNSLKNQADNAKLLIENHSTTIGVMQGQINTAINNTQIVKDGKTILLKDDYNRTASKVDSINSTIGTHTTKINELTGNITSVDTKVNSIQRDLEGTKSTVSSHTNLIDGLNSKVSTQGSSIEQLKNQITLKVNSTELTTMKNELIGKIDSIEIGGRNLFLKSNIDQYGLGNWIGNGGGIGNVEGTFIDGTKTIKVTGSSGIQYNSFIKLKRNTTYVYSMMMKSSGSMIVNSSNPLHMWLNTSETGGQHLEKVISTSGKLEANKWTKVWVVFETPNTQDVYYMKPFVYGIGTNTVYISKVQIEEGTKCTDWTSAPEDVQGMIDSKANTTDVYKKSETYTKAQTDSAIKVAKDSIELGVKNTYETKTNVENKISTAVSKIQIGGRNLAYKETIKPFSSSTLVLAEYVKNGKLILTRPTGNGDGGFYFDKLIKYKENSEYIVHFYMTCTKGTVENIHFHNGQKLNSTRIYIDDIYVGNIGKVINTSVFDDGLSHKVRMEYTTPSTLVDSSAGVNQTYFQPNKMLSNNTYTVIIEEFMVEEGTKASSWTPAPEDVTVSIDSKANKSDVYAKSETYSKTETDSKINVAKDSINLGVSQTYETKTNVTSKVNTAKTEAVNISKSYADTKKTEAINSANATTTEKLKSYSTTAQMNSAIQVAKDSITNTVSSTYAKKADVESTYATKSSLTQTANNITASFKASGGYNLIANSTGYNGTKLWTSGGATMGTATNNNIGGATNMYMYLDNGTKTTESFAFSKRFKLKANTKYTLSGWFHNFTKCPSFDVFLLSSTSVAQSDTGTSYTNAQTLISSQNTSGSWKKFSVTFTTPASVISGYIRIDNNGYNSSGTNSNRVHWSALMLNEGEEQPWSPHPDEIYNGSTVIDASGVTINNGALTVKNNSGATVLRGDSNGNLDITGTVKSQKGNMYVSLDYGGLTFQSAHNNEQLLRMETTSFTSNKDINGVDLNLAKQGEYISFNHINKENLNNGWSSSDGRYNFMDFWSKDTTLGSKTYKKGINVNSPMYVNKGLKLYSGTNFYADIDGAISWNNGTGTVSNLLGMYGDNGAVLGYKSGESFNARFLVTEASHPGTGDNLISWGNYNFNGWTFHNANIVAKSLSVQGSKNCLQETKNYGSRLINAYETAEYYFGDLGFGKINEEGVCYVDIDDVFLECVNTDAQYHVFTQIYNGKITSIERYKTYFIVKGEPNTEFSWELKAKRKGYEINRLDLPDIETQGDEIDIFSFENEIETDEEDLMKELTFELENLLLKEHEEDE